MSSFIRTGLIAGDKLALVFDNEVEAVFEVTEFTTDRFFKVTDNEGRTFTSVNGREVWIHPYVMIRFPVENLTTCSKYGYKYTVQIFISGMRRIHFVRFLERKEPKLYEQAITMWG